MNEHYFGLTREQYLQHLANRHGDFGVSWNWKDEHGEMRFTKRRSVIQLHEEGKGRLEKVMHRQCMMREIFVEIDDAPMTAQLKLNKTKRFCVEHKLPYCVYKSRKGYHISVLDLQWRVGRYKLINHIKSDSQFLSPRNTWSMEWTAHWKQKSFVIYVVEMTPDYPAALLGHDLFPEIKIPNKRKGFYILDVVKDMKLKGVI
jgi:hypothetical protein